MKFFVINLKQDKNKLDNIIKQFSKYNISNFEIVNAIDGNKLTEEQVRLYSNNKISKKLCNALSLSEIGCSLSHLEVYKKILQENKRCLILEDDAEFDSRLKLFNDIEIESAADVLFFGLFTSNIEQENQDKTYLFEKINRSPNDLGLITRCYLKRSYETIANINFFDIDEQSYKIDLLCSTHAYSPSLYFCKTAIKLNTPVVFKADMIWNYYYKFSLKCSEDALVTQSLKFKSSIVRNTQSYSNMFLERVTSETFGT